VLRTTLVGTWVDFKSATVNCSGDSESSKCDSRLDVKERHPVWDSLAVKKWV